MSPANFLGGSAVEFMGTPPGLSFPAEPGHVVQTFTLSGTTTSRVSLRFWFQAPPTTGPRTIKVALAREQDLSGPFNPGAWSVVQPPNTTGFAQVGGAHAVTFDVASEALPRWTRRGLSGTPLQSFSTGGIAVHPRVGGDRFFWDVGAIGEIILDTNGVIQVRDNVTSGGTLFGASQPACGDFNADGLVDFFGTQPSLGNLTGTFTPIPGVSYNDLGTAVVGDVNGDGYDDAVWSGPSSSLLCGVWNNATQTFDPSMQGLPGPRTGILSNRYLLLEDLNDDGSLDIAWMTVGSPGYGLTPSSSGIWLNDGNANWTEVMNPGLGTRDYWTAKAADFDGDGATDLICSGYESGAGSGIAFFRRGQDANGNVTWIEDTTTGLPISSPYLDMALADFDRDGFVDILAGRGVEGLSSGGLEIWRNLGGGRFEQAPSSWTEGLPEIAMGNAVGLAVGDADADGSLDIAISSQSHGFRLYTQNPQTWSLPCAAGTVWLGAGGPYDLLSVNGRNGGLDRRVEVDRTAPITISMAQPPASPSPANYVIFGSFGEATQASVFASPWGDFCFTPAPFAPRPGLFVLANTMAPQTGILLLGPTPFSYIRSAGLGFSETFTLQGLILFGAPASSNLGVTNAVTVEVR